MAITINSKFVKFNYVKYRTVEGKDGPQPYVREDIAEILDAIVNYGAIAFISGYDNKLPWPRTNATINMPNPEILSGNVIFAQGKWFGTSKDSLEDALGDSKIIEKLENVLNIGHPAKPAVGEPNQEGYVPAVEATGIFAEIDNLRFFNQIAVPVDGTSQYVMGAAKPGATLTIKGEGSTKVTANAGTITISSEAGETTTKNNIIIAGGPLANNVTETGDTWPTDWKDDAGNKIIPKNKSLEDILKVLFLQEKYGTLTDPVYAWDPTISTTPVVDIKENTTTVKDRLVPVGTEVSVSFSPSGEAINQATATISGATYGYSLDGENIITDGTSYTANATGQTVTGTLAIESATFQGEDVKSQVAEAKYKVKEGDNTLSVKQSGLTVTPGTFADATVYNVSNTRTINVQDSKTINQAGFEAATSVYAGGSKALSNSISVKVTGYYPIYYGWLNDTDATINKEYIIAHFVDRLKAQLTMTPNATRPTETSAKAGNATFILALRGTGYTEDNKITVLNKTNSAPAGTIQFVEVTNAHDTETYTVFFAANASGLENAATFNITYNK